MPVGPRRYSDDQIRFVLDRSRRGHTHAQIVDAYRTAYNVACDFGPAQVKYIKSAYGEAAEFGYGSSGGCYALRFSLPPPL